MQGQSRKNEKKDAPHKSTAHKQKLIEDDRYNQTDLVPQDRYNEIPQNRHRKNAQDRVYPQLNRSPNKCFKYHYSDDDLEARESEPRRRGHHYREY